MNPPRRPGRRGQCRDGRGPAPPGDDLAPRTRRDAARPHRGRRMLKAVWPQTWLAGAWPWRWPDLGGLLALALVYGVTMRLVMGYLTADGFISIVWIPSGLGLAALLTGGRRLWPGILAGAWAAYLSVGRGTLPALCFALGNTLEPLLAVWLLTRDGRFDRALHRVQDYARLAGAAALGAALAALIGVATLAASTAMTADELLTGLRLWWMGDFLGAVVVAPLLLVWRRPPRGWLTARRVPETLGLLTLTFLCGQAVFLGRFADPLGPVAGGYWLFLFVAWGAVRYGRHGALLVVGLASLQGLLGAVWGLGLFAADSSATQLTNYWFYTLILCTTGLSLALLVEGWGQALAAAQAAQAESGRLLEETEQARRGLLGVVAQQQETEAQLRTERDLRQRYLDTVEAVILALDRDGRITLINRKGYRLLGYSEDELLGKNWFRVCLLQPEGRDLAYPVFAQMMAGRLEAHEYFENEVLTRTGDRRLMAWHNSILHDPRGEPAGTLSAGEDITDRRRAQVRSEEQLEELRRWHRITLGREARVLELKREVNELLANHDEPPRYPSAAGDTSGTPDPDLAPPPPAQ